MFGSGFASARAQAIQQAAHVRLMQQYNRYRELRQIYGDAFAGVTQYGALILWRKTTIPAAQRRKEDA